MNSKFNNAKLDRLFQTGFTLIELLVVVAVLAVLAMLLLPALANSRTDSQSFQCLNNHRQLALAWRMYAEDNNDYLAANDYISPGSGSPGVPLFPARGGRNWVNGTMTFGTGNQENTNLYNLSVLFPPSGVTSLASSGGCQLGEYTKNPKVYKCPADPSVVDYGPRVRSVSMNSAIGTKWNSATTPKGTQPVDAGWLDGNYHAGQSQKGWVTYAKMSQTSKSGPANLWVIVDEHPNSINDPVFQMAMGTPDVNGNATSQNFIDAPASYHNGACTFAFVDGHAEIHKWLGTVIKKVPNNPTALYNNFAAGDSLVDLRWLQLRTTAQH